MILAVLNHLWQSTLWLGGAGLLTLLLRHAGAHTRYWLWFAASVKFIVPFAVDGAAT
jgi:bla regulator protein blaR1